MSRSLAELKDEDVPNDLLPLLRIRIDLTDYKGVTIQVQIVFGLLRQVSVYERFSLLGNAVHVQTLIL